MNELLTAFQPWYPSIGAFCFFTLLRYIYKHFLLKLLHRINHIISLKNGEGLLTAFEQPVNFALFSLALYSAVNLAPIASLNNHQALLDRLLRSAFAISFFWGCYNVSDTTHGVMLTILEKAGIRSEETLSNIFATLMRLIIVVLGFVTVAREWNYDISAFIASLSIGSVAVAFAAKDALANVFGSLIIILDKPFKNGDWVMANGIEGIVENVSFRSTCIRTFTQELVYIPNSLLSNTPITNFTLREKRQINFTLGLTYATTAAQMESLVAEIKAYLQSNPHIYGDNVRVHFVTYNESSLDVRVTCYARTGDHVEYLNILQEINLRIMQLMEQAGVSCAFPSRSIYLENTGGKQAPADNVQQASAMTKES